MFYKKLINFSFLFFLVFFTRVAFGANFTLSPSSGNLNVGDTIKVNIVLSSTDKTANAVSGVISFPSNLLKLNSISKTNSIINVWPVEPSYSNTKGTINFDGVTLSGYKGSNGVILTLFFEAKAAGSANIKFNNPVILAHDGLATPILTSAGQANFNLTSLIPKKLDEIKKDIIEIADTPSVHIEELKKKDILDPRSRFLITSNFKKPESFYKIKIDNMVYLWKETEDSVFETVELSRGLHSIEVSFETVTGEILSKAMSFSTTSILTPVFTDYSNNIKENNFIVIKGIVDPLNYVVITSDALSNNNNNYFHESVIIQSDEKGHFTYVSKNRVSEGVYMITAQAKTENGIESPITSPVKISVEIDSEMFFDKITDAVAIVVPLIGLLVLFIIIILFGWHRILHYRQKMRKRLLETRTLINKSFDILEEDADIEALILKKQKSGKMLTKKEIEFISQFKDDIGSSKEIITDDLSDADKSI